MTNLDVARDLIERLAARGIRDFCVCAGSRNAPLLAVLSRAGGAHLFSFVDERAAAFFALGRMRMTGLPVAVITTSGTAVAQLLPAAIEAHYAALPLVLLTADRPSRFRGTGAPQAIEQQTIFGVYTSRDLDRWDGLTPLHINVEFDEPLLDAQPIEWKLPPGHARLRRQQGGEAFDPSNWKARKPIVLVGRLHRDDRAQVREALLQLRAPIYAEALSGLREESVLRELLITAGERMIARGNFDGVIRIGGIPTARFWRDLEESRRDLPVVHFTDVPFPGLSRGGIHPLSDLALLPPAGHINHAFFDYDRVQAARLDDLLARDPQSEPALFRALSREVPRTSRVYLGNSLPIREWDLFAVRDPRELSYEANRGANGIDGQLSTFFGWCAPAASNLCIVGDLTALYDLNAPWICTQLDARVNFRLVVVNNRGGRIFSRVPSLAPIDAQFRRSMIENEHVLRFDDWASMWSLDYEWSALVAPMTTNSRGVLELAPDGEATRRFWADWDALWR